MPFNVNEFRNKFVHGGARTSSFEMQIVWPDAVRGGAGVAASETDFRFLCHLSEIPASTVKSIAVSYFGRKIYYAGDRSFASLKVTIYNDEDFKVRKAFEVWSQAITAHQSTISQFDGGNIAGSYATDGIVRQLSRNLGGSGLVAYKFIGMFPTDLSAIVLDWEKPDEFEKFTVEFAYQYWIPVDGNTGAPLVANF